MLDWRCRRHVIREKETYSGLTRSGLKTVYVHLIESMGKDNTGVIEMHSFRLRLILALIAGVTLVSVASTYFEVLAHKHALRQELERRSTWIGTAIRPEIERALAAGNLGSLPAIVTGSKAAVGALGVGVYDPAGKLVASEGVPEVFEALSHPPFKSLAKTPVQSLARTNVEKSIIRGAQVNAFGSTGKVQWLEEVFPLHEGNRLVGALVVLIDTAYIRESNHELWQGSFWRIVAFVVLIVGVTFVMVRWFLMRPLMRVAERLRHLRMGHVDKGMEAGGTELSIFSPLAREVETMAESLIAARAAAAAEARLRDAGEHLWTPERLAVHIRNKGGDGRIFVVSNREPYMHVRKGRETVCIVPPSGLVTAIEPVLRACDGVWVASGSGNADAQNVDQFDRLRVPPDDPRYTLRRVWLSAEEESRYYDGFANEGLWPLCHIAHTRPIFRATDWEAYQEVNEKFANAVLDRNEGEHGSAGICTGLSLCVAAAPGEGQASRCESGDLLAYTVAKSGGIRDLSVAGAVAGWPAWRRSHRFSHSTALQ